MGRTEAVWALGAMSGTSLDGVDAAMVLTDGETVFETGASGYRPYTATETRTLHEALGRWPGEDVAAALGVIQTAHAELLSRFDGAEIVGFHGQTLAHAPRGRGTHQLGDGAALSQALGIPVVWDFRSEDVRQGGEGAPLAPFYHFACARAIGARAPLAVLNLGGVGNLTWIDPSKSGPEVAGALLAFDTGPANAPINDLMTQRRDLPFDEDGALAARGQVDESVVERFLEEDFFRKPPPKSLDRNDFPTLHGLVQALEDADAAASLTAMSAAAVARGLENCPAAPERVLVTGGGRRNPVMMAMLADRIGCPVDPVEAVGLDGDMLEAQAFAFLAVRVLHGLPTSCSGTTGVASNVCGGVISRPRQELRIVAG